MKLNLNERFAVLQIIPQEGNFATLRVVRKLQEDLSFSEEDFELLQAALPDCKIYWSQSRR